MSFEQLVALSLMSMVAAGIIYCFMDGIFYELRRKYWRHRRRKNHSRYIASSLREFERRNND